jgi:UDP-N-acetylmuramoyl-tripeptide--D-alanyl-D-alanine ligase
MKFRTRELVAGLSDCRVLGETDERVYKRISIDSRTTKPGDLFLALKGDLHDGHDFTWEARRRGAIGFVVSSPPDTTGGGIQVFEVPDTLIALHELAAVCRAGFKGQVVGITGSNGKTTTKEMVANVLSTKYHVHRNPGNFNNQIGLPLSILGLKARTEWMVLEMGSNFPGEISTLSRIAEPQWGIITNVSEVHLEGLGNLVGVLKEKASILDGLQDGGTLIVNGDDPSLTSYIRNLGMKYKTFGIRQGNDVHPEDYMVHGDGKTSFNLGDGLCIDLPMIGYHGLQNAMAACALGLEAGLRPELIKQGLERPLNQHFRMEVSNEFNITFINDCYNANPRSMYLAAEALSLMEGEGRKILVLGDMLELGEVSARLHKELGKRLSSIDIDLVVTVGGLGAVVGRAMRREDLRRGRRREVVETMEYPDACAGICSFLRAGDVILFKASRRMKMEDLVGMVRSELRKRGSMN